MQHLINLQKVAPSELETLLQREIRLWRELFYWDVSGRVATLKSVLARRGVPGVALRLGTRIIGYAYYLTVGRLGILAGLDVAPEQAGSEVLGTLVKAAVQALRQHHVTRIESPFVFFEHKDLLPAFEQEGFCTYWREYLRLRPHVVGGHTDAYHALSQPKLALEPWRGPHLAEAADVMCAAYAGTADGRMSLHYCTISGCRFVLEHIVQQHNSGVLVPCASAFVRHRGQGVGFIIITEISPRQGHLAQIAVHPDFQGQGVGRLLLNYSLSQLVELKFDTLSLIVSRDNTQALNLYLKMGFQSIFAFPVFVYEGEGEEATRNRP